MLRFVLDDADIAENFAATVPVDVVEQVYEVPHSHSWLGVEFTLRATRRQMMPTAKQKNRQV